MTRCVPWGVSTFKNSQNLEFLFEFLTGMAYEVVERFSGCSFDANLDILHERCGQLAAVGAACKDNLNKRAKVF